MLRFRWPSRRWLCQVGLHAFPRSHWGGSCTYFGASDLSCCKRGCGTPNLGIAMNYPSIGSECPPYSCEIHHP